MKKYILTLVGLFFVFNLSAQDILLEKDTDELYSISDFGPNRKHFMHLYGGMGFYSVSSSEFKPFNTNEFFAGLRYKRKYSSLISGGTALYWKHSNFRYDADPKIIDKETFYDKEKLNVNSIGTELYIRINFDKDRGNYVGDYVDVGGYGEWLFSDAYKTYEKSESSLFKKKKTVYRQLEDVSKFGYGVLLRMAKNRFVFFINYRFSDYFDSDIEEPARVVIGLELGLHK
ncbi:MAG: hypothetical protein ACQESJ_07945 [Bacteroidota bacterium]